VRIKPDVYQANKRSSQSSFNSALSGIALAEANQRKAQLECKRNDALFAAQLISESQILEFKTALDIAQAQLDSSRHQLAVSKAALDRAEEELAKTTIYSPIEGTVSKQNLEVGERVAGNTMMAGTEILTVAELHNMEARVDIGEIDIVLIAKDQTAELEVDAFRDRKFKGTVTEIANSSKGAGVATASTDATKFEVKIRIDEQENFRPGMSVTAEIRTRSRTNTLSVPVQAVTTRLPQAPTNAPATASNSTKAPPKPATNTLVSGKNNETNKPIEVVFVVDNERVRMVPVKRGINDDTAAEILSGLSEGQEIVCGGYRAVSRELAEGKKIRKQKPADAKTDKAETAK
jgi:HlyD family secretion protein